MPKQFTNVSKLLEMAIKRYQFDVVGWTRYCTESTSTERKALPIQAAVRRTGRGIHEFTVLCGMGSIPL